MDRKVMAFFLISPSKMAFFSILLSSEYIFWASCQKDKLNIYIVYLKSILITINLLKLANNYNQMFLLMDTHLEEILYMIFIYFTGTKNCLPKICLKYWKLNKSDTWKNK